MFEKKKKAAEAAAEETKFPADAEMTAEELEAEVAAEFDDIPDAELVDEPEEQTDPVAEELAQLKDSYQRLAAEYDNFRKRTAREKEAIAADVRAGCISALLPVMDNLERALAADMTSAEALHKGIEMVLSQTGAIFEQMGVASFGEAGEEFDPRGDGSMVKTLPMACITAWDTIFSEAISSI